MNRKSSIIIVILCIVILITSVVVLLMFRKNNIKKFDNKVVSKFTIDVNPSLEVSLNKDDVVVEVKPLNDDSKIIVSNIPFEGKTIEDTLNIIVTNLKDNEYLTDDTKTVLINVISNDKSLSDKIKNNFVTVSNENNLVIDVLLLEVPETSELKELADKYNISIGKAYYIKENLDEKIDESFEDLVNDSLEELQKVIDKKQKLLEEELEKELEKEKVQENNDNNNQSGSNAAPVNQGGGCNPPAVATENISAWCTFNKTRSQTCDFTYAEMLDYSAVNNLALSHLGLSSWDTIGNYNSQIIDDSRSSYCISKIAVVTTRQKRTTIIFDSVTGNIISETSENVPTPCISEDAAVEILLKYYGLNKSECRMCQANFSTNAEGSDNWYYRYDTGILMNDGTQHLANISPFTGEIIEIIY